jgi:hypothetical protein
MDEPKPRTLVFDVRKNSADAADAPFDQGPTARSRLPEVGTTVGRQRGRRSASTAVISCARMPR